MGTASWEEIVWVVLACIALVYNWINYRAGALAVRALVRQHVNGRYLRVARQFRRNDLGRTLKQLGFLIIGIGAALDWPFLRSIFLFVMFGMQAWLVVGAYLDKRDREYLQDHPRSVEEKAHEEGIGSNG